MRHLVVDLDTRIKILLLEDDTILDIHSVEFTSSVTSMLVSAIEHFIPDKVTYVTHNMLAQCLYTNSKIAFELGDGADKYASLINESDMNICIDICARAGITDVSFVDKFGYYAQFAQADTCFVENYTGIYRFIYIDGDKVAYTICTPDVYEETLKRFMNQTGATNVMNENELTDTSDLMYFTNAVTCLDDEKVVHDLVIFAYACLHEGKFRYVPAMYNAYINKEETHTISEESGDGGAAKENTNSVQDDDLVISESKSTKSSELREVDSLVDSDLDDDGYGEYGGTDREGSREDDMENDDYLENSNLKRKSNKPVKMKRPAKTKKPKVPRASKTPNNNTAGLIVNVLTAVGIFALVITGTLYFMTYSQNTKLTELNKTLDANQVMISSINTAITSYQAYLKDDNENILDLYSNTMRIIDVTDDTYLKTFSYLDGTVTLALHTDLASNKDKLQEMCDQNGYTLLVTNQNATDNSSEQQDGQDDQGDQDQKTTENDKNTENTKDESRSEAKSTDKGNFDIEISISDTSAIEN